MCDGRLSLVPSTHLQLNSLAIGQRTCALTFVAAHSPRRCDPGETTHFLAIYCVLHALRRCLVTKLTPWECQHSTFLMCFERFERISGNQMDSLGVPTLNLSKCFTRFERMPGNKIDSLGVPTFNASIVCYTLWKTAGQQSCFPRAGHIQDIYCVLHALRGCRVTKLIPSECPHSTFLLCFTSFERDA